MRATCTRSVPGVFIFPPFMLQQFHRISGATYSSFRIHLWARRFFSWRVATPLWWLKPEGDGKE